MSVVLLEQFCAECFKRFPDSDRRATIEAEASELIERCGWEGADRVWENIKKASTLGQALDHLAILRVARILTPAYSDLCKPILEFACQNHPSKGPHDIVLPLSGNRRVIVEVKRFAESTLGGDHLEDQVTEYVCCHGRFELNGDLHELREDPSKSTNSWKLLLETIDEKAKTQFDPNRLNLVWFVSRNALFRGSVLYSGIAHHYAKGWGLMNTNQLGKSHLPPKGLVGVAWSFDGPDGSHDFEPCCFFVGSQPSLIQHLNELQLTVRHF